MQAFLLPAVYIFRGQHLLCVRLRQAGRDAIAGAREELKRIVAQIREQWKETCIVIRAWCEHNQVDYVIGLARKAAAEHKRTFKAARAFAEFGYRARKSWPRMRRVVAKARQLDRMDL